MIDNTSLTIDQMEAQIRRDNERRYTFYRLLHTTDRVLWRLEEMNRDGIKTIPDGTQDQIRETLAGLPPVCRSAYRDSKAVQDVLDSVFEIQECLFKWRDPRWAVDEDDEMERLAG